MWQLDAIFHIYCWSLSEKASKKVFSNFRVSDKLTFAGHLQNFYLVLDNMEIFKIQD
jgi:hypothetical protein